MLNIPRVLLLLIMILVALLIAVGCDKESGTDEITGPHGEQGPQGDTGLAGPDGEARSTDINVFATVELGPTAGDVWADFRASVYNASNIPNLRVNDRAFEPDNSWFWDGGRLAYRQSVYVPNADSILLEIEYTRLDSTIGTGTASVKMAGEFSSLNDTLYVGWGEDVEMGWESSPGADAYWLGLYFIANYRDSSGTNTFNYEFFDTLLSVEDTVMMLLTSGVFPDSSEFMSITNIYGYGWIRALTGPWLPGDVSNFSGDANGVFVGSMLANSVYIKYAAPASVPVTAVEPTEEIERLFEKRIREIPQKQKQGRNNY